MTQEGGQLILWVQIIFMWLIVRYYFLYLGTRLQRAPIDDVGIMWAVMLTMYATSPVVTWLMEGGYYPIYYGRLADLAPSESDHVYLLNIAFGYLLSFVIVNSLFQDKSTLTPNIRPVIIPARIVFVSGILVLVGIIFEFGLKFSEILRPASDYSDSYLAVSELPVVIGQMYKITFALANFGTGVIVVGLMQNYKKFKWLLLIYLLSMVLSYDVTANRSSIVTALFRLVVCWHVIVKNISNRKILVGGLIGLAIFNTLGFYRGLLEGADTQLSRGIGEFLMVYGNALELLQLEKTSPINVPWQIQYAEFYSFIPSQLFAFGKNSLDNWYTETFHPFYFNSGGGLAFGALSQAVIGFGILEAIIRGATLGFLFAKLSNKVRRTKDKWWYFPVQLYFLVYIYYSVRSSTFSFIGAVFQVIIPSILFISLISKLTSRNERKSNI